MKITVLNNKGKETGKSFELKKEIFAVEGKRDVLRQSIHVHLANTRTGTAKAKGRGEVSGTGRKPWGNNKMGRARTGDMRTPIYRHGGVSHGPVPMNYSLKMPKKMEKIALHVALSEGVSAKKVYVVEDVTFKGDRLAKTAATLLHAMKESTAATLKNTVIYVAQTDESLLRAFRNIPGVSVLHISHMNAYDVVRASDVFFFESAMEVLLGAKAVKSAEPKATVSKTTATKEAAPKATAAKKTATPVKKEAVVKKNITTKAK